MFATNDVSMFVMSVRMNAISLRAFSSITLGSCDVQRKQFGAKTMAKLDESIFVWATMSGIMNCCRKCTKYVRTFLERYRCQSIENVTQKCLTSLFSGCSLLMMAVTSSGLSVATQSLYRSSGINGSYSSRYHNFSRLAGA